ncbi:hypothetical protein [Acidocella sp.]|jgi:hypothetical protein|uniref:hypothetical protein n=1 Tax=Acidocella sp. TaxID=50710 RepID=UPI00263A2FCA|nr:hypothetical protein [Acidocella sp.]
MAGWIWTRRDGAGAALAAVIGGGAFAFRHWAIVPRATVGICAAARPPGWCAPRGWVLHWQYLGAFGWAALLAGLAAFFWGGRVAAGLAVGLGIAAMVNYNGTQGGIGAALGLITWLSLLSGRPGWQASRQGA